MRTDTFVFPQNNTGNDDCPEHKREDYQKCSVLYCIHQLCTVICTQKYNEQFFQVFS